MQNLPASRGNKCIIATVAASDHPAAMPVHATKTIYDPVEPEADGLRILATRFWPRGVQRAAADLYLPDLAPSKDLLQAFKAGQVPWPEFQRRYKAEMKGQTSLLRTLRWLDARGDILTVMCSCEATEQCHRYILKGMIGRAD